MKILVITSLVSGFSFICHFFLVSGLRDGSGTFASDSGAGVNDGGGGRFEILVGRLIFKLLQR